MNREPPLAAARVARAPPTRRTPTTTRGARRDPCPARSTCGRSCAGSTRVCPTTRSSPTAPATTRCGCIACTAIAAFARSSRRTPARWATACRRRSRPRPCIRERIVVSWNGDGCFLMNGQELATAVQYGLADHLRRHRQRHVRDDPHASGAQLSGARLRHRPRQSGLRGAGARLRRARRDGGAHRGIRAGLRARAGAAAGPSLLHVKLDPQALTMNASLDALRAQGEAAR